MGAFGVVVRAPGSQRGAGIAQRRKQGFLQEFVSQTTVETFDEGILGRLAGGDVQPVYLAVIGEGQDRVPGELGPVVNGDRTNGASIGNSLTTVAGLPGVSHRIASSRTTLAPESEVSAIRARHSRV